MCVCTVCVLQHMCACTVCVLQYMCACTVCALQYMCTCTVCVLLGNNRMRMITTDGFSKSMSELYTQNKT